MKKFLTLALALMVALGAQVQTVVAMDASAHGVVNPFAAKAQAIRECLKRINDDGSAKADVAEFDFLAQLNSAGVLKSAVKSSEVQKILENLKDEVVYLEVTISNAAPRVGFNKDRPLLAGNPRAKWQELMEVRRPIYERLAGRKVSTDNRKPNEVAAEIAKAVLA